MPEYQYRNIVELLVEQEVEHQLSKLPPHVAGMLPSIQVVTYVLNRLKPFYACTERGFEEQLKRAEHELRGKIRQNVKMAMNLVYQNPIQGFSPLQEDEKEAALEALRGLLHDNSIQWKDLPKILGSTLEQVIQTLPQDGDTGEITAGSQQADRRSGQGTSRWGYKRSTDAGVAASGTQANSPVSDPQDYRPPHPAIDATTQEGGVTWQDFKRRREAAQQQRSNGNHKDAGTPRNYRLNNP